VILAIFDNLAEDLRSNVVKRDRQVIPNILSKLSFVYKWRCNVFVLSGIMCAKNGGLGSNR
jgi:hypothetical protein